MPPCVVCTYKTGGVPCDCPKFELRQDQDPNEPFVCRDCTHVKNWHEADNHIPDSTTVQAIMKNCDAALEGVQKNKLGNPRISKDEAAQEAITGLKRDVQSEKASKKKTTRKRDIKVSTRIEVRGVIMLPDGISDDGELNNDATPDGEVEGNLESWGLAVLGAKGTLWFCEEWNNERLDEWLREILPKPFSFLDNEYGVPADAKKWHWRLLESSRKRLKKHRLVADGYAFKEVKGTAGKAWTEYKIYIVSCQPISPKIYMNEWNTDTVSLSLFDDSDSDLINSPRSTGLTAAGQKHSTSKASLGNPSKGKKRARTPDPTGSISDHESINIGDPDIWVWDDEDFPEPSSLLSDDKWANKPTTRSQTQAYTASTSARPIPAIRMRRHTFDSPPKTKADIWE